MRPFHTSVSSWRTLLEGRERGLDSGALYGSQSSPQSLETRRHGAFLRQGTPGLLLLYPAWLVVRMYSTYSNMVLKSTNR
ncbi:hypothetical protein GQ53DRAFT_749112 [Thozetella sp. PMI_491]|nr:hypothetical protein GQ53DRAFT_749112 [Thozetella sp. PMI_491]